MRVTFLGTGTSQGIPVIACKCAACVSKDKHDDRLRTSILIEVNGKNILIDVGPDFRQQMLREKIQNIDAVILTHEHNDHMIGADDLRPFNFAQRKDMPIYGEQRVLDDLRDRFKYAFIPHPYPGIPKFNLIPLNPKLSFQVSGVDVIPIRIFHGELPILGYRFGDFCYLTDVKTIPESEFQKLKGIKVLVLSALRKKAHHSHLTVEEALVMAKRINAETTFLIHFSHDLGPVSDWSRALPSDVIPSYDGLQIEVD